MAVGRNSGVGLENGVRDISTFKSIAPNSSAAPRSYDATNRRLVDQRQSRSASGPVLCLSSRLDGCCHLAARKSFVTTEEMWLGFWRYCRLVADYFREEMVTLGQAHCVYVEGNRKDVRTRGRRSLDNCQDRQILIDGGRTKIRPGLA